MASDQCELFADDFALWDALGSRGRRSNPAVPTQVRGHFRVSKVVFRLPWERRLNAVGSCACGRSAPVGLAHRAPGVVQVVALGDRRYHRHSITSGDLDTAIARTGIGETDIFTDVEPR
jgi:hypothetical protein